MSPEKAVKKAYPKMSTNEVKRVVRLIKKQTINQGPNSTMNIHLHNSPRIQDNRGRRELAIQDNTGRGDYQDSHARKWAHGSYGEKTAQHSYFIKEANMKAIEKNIEKGMNPVQAVKKAYPNWSDKKVVQFIKDVQATQEFKEGGGKGKPKFGKYANEINNARGTALHFIKHANLEQLGYTPDMFIKEGGKAKKF